MRKIKRKILLAMIIAGCMMLAEPLISNLAPNNISIVEAAKKKNVTKQKKRGVSKLLKPYENFFAFTPSDKTFKFDNYYKTNMVLYSSTYFWYYDDAPIKTVKKAILPTMKELFGKSAKFKIKEYKNGYDFTNYPGFPHIYVSSEGKLKYIRGNWGDNEKPFGKIKKIYKTSKNKYLVSYSMYFKDSNTSKIIPNSYMGTYNIYLKANGKSYTITNVKIVDIAEE